MRYVLRNWTCRNCGKANKTGIQLDGSAKCDFCAHVMRIQPSSTRGGETPGQMSRFARSTP